jgi:hypothetical protein
VAYEDPTLTCCASHNMSALGVSPIPRAESGLWRFASHQHPQMVKPAAPPIVWVNRLK